VFERRATAHLAALTSHSPYAGDVAVSARDVAAVLRSRLPGLPSKKLHKLLYYCQGHHLAAFDEPLFVETISAWDMGPVVPTLWHEEREGYRPEAIVTLTEAQLNTVGYVISRYSGLTGQDLENLSHGEAPWQLANRGRRPRDSVRIEHEWIKGYFATNGSAGDAEEEALFDSESVTQWLLDAQHRRKDPLRPDSPEVIRARLRSGG
jgi:uncharacterized phage-associated protein